MRRRLSEAPQWLLSLVLGVWFGVGTTVIAAATQPHRSLPAVLVGGVVGGTFFGWFMGRWSVGQRESARAIMAVADREQELRVIRAANHGARPDEDREVRAAAARLVRHRLDLAAGQRRWAVPFILAVTILGVAYSVLRSPVFWFVPVLCIGWLIAMAVQPGRLARRLRQLGG